VVPLSLITKRGEEIGGTSLRVDSPTQKEFDAKREEELGVET